MEYFNYYLILINIVGFILFAIDIWLYSNTKKGQIDTAVTITALLGGALGVVIGILLFNRKAFKENMMSRVFVFCILVIQIIICLMLNGNHQEEISFAFIDFFSKHMFLIIYILAMNIITFVAFAIDKYNAKTHRSRIAIVTLLILAFIGGAIGGLLAMYIFRHKTKKDYFVVGIPLIIVMQIVVIFYLMNVG